MKKLLITVCLSGLLSVPSAVLGAEMAGPSLYGSFRTGLMFGDGDASVSDIGSRWGITGSHEVAEGLTASYTLEVNANTTNAETAGGAGHSHDAVADDPDNLDEDENNDNENRHGHDATSANGGPGGRLSSVSLSGGFGAITLGQIWSASGVHYGFKLDGSYWNGTFGGASGRIGNVVSYSSSAGDVSFQIDKTTGDDEALELGASASLGPVGVGLGYSNSTTTEGKPSKAGFSGLAVSAGAAGVDLTIGLGSSSSAAGVKSKTNILRVAGSVGDSGLSYSLQLANSNKDGGAGDSNLLIVTNSLGSGASLIFEHVSPGDGEASSLIGLKVDF